MEFFLKNGPLFKNDLFQQWLYLQKLDPYLSTEPNSLSFNFSQSMCGHKVPRANDFLSKARLPSFVGDIFVGSKNTPQTTMDGLQDEDLEPGDHETTQNETSSHTQQQWPHLQDVSLAPRLANSLSSVHNQTGVWAVLLNVLNNLFLKNRHFVQN
jgi:hypothetical protein